MRTPAEQHAQALLEKYGQTKAAEIVYQKIDDAPFLVNDDRNFWIAVREALGVGPKVG